MSDLTRFEKMGMVAVGKGHGKNPFSGGDVILSYNRNRKEVYISFERPTFKIAFNGVDGTRLLPILDAKRGRVYLVTDESGYIVRGNYNYKDGKVETKPNFVSKPLYAEMTKHNLSRQAYENLTFDVELNAYYIQVE